MKFFVLLASAFIFNSFALMNPTFAAKPKKQISQPVLNQGTPAATAPVVSEHNSANSAHPKTKAILKNISVYGYYNMADKNNYEASAQQSFTGEINTTNSYGAGLETQFKQLENGIYVKGGVSYEFGRTYNKYTMKGDGQEQAGSQSFGKSKPELSMWIFHLAGELPLSEELSVIGGGNFNFPSYKNFTGTFSGKLGWQAGASYKISEGAYIDGLWRSANLSGSNDNVSFDNINIAGFIVRGRLSFQ